MTDFAYGVGANAMGTRWVEAYNFAKAIRMPFEADWRNVARFGLPRHYSGWSMTSGATPAAGAGAARQARIDSYDSTLARSLNMYGAVLERMLTPGAHVYHKLKCVDERTWRQRSVQLYCERLNRQLFIRRYDAHAKFVQTQGEIYISGGGYGNACKLITWRKAEQRFGRPAGFSYRNIPFRDVFWIIDADGIIRTWFRRINWTAKQASDELKQNCPQEIVAKAKMPSANDPAQTYEFVQVITPSEDYDSGALDRRRYALVSLYLYVKEKTIVREPEGFRSNPLVTPRHFTEGDNPYGYGPAQLILSSVGVANSQVRSDLRGQQRASEPPLLTKDDGIIPDLRPGKTTPGGIDSQGRPTVKAIELGNWQMNEKSLELTRSDIRDPLFGRIFDIITDRPQRSIPEVIDDIGREASLLAPTMGRMQSEDIALMIEREIALMAENDALPDEMPDEFRDAEFRPVYTSPMALALQSESTGNYLRLLASASEVAKMTGNPRVLRHFALDRALPDIADQQAIPALWMASAEEVAAGDQQDQQTQQQQQTVDALPGIAGVAKVMADNKMKPAAA